jgi:hypothetical protein
MQAFARVAVSAAILTACVAQASAQNLSGVQILEAWGDKPLTTKLANGTPMGLVFSKDGKVVATGRFSDEGTWKPTDLGYCTKWTKFNNGEERCFIVIRRQDGGFIVNTAQGALSANVDPIK